MRRRLWILNQHFPPDMIATAEVVVLLAEALAHRGWEIEVFAGTPSMPDPERFQYEGPVKVHWIPTPPRAPTIRGRLGHYIAWYRGALRALRKRSERPDLLLALSTPPLLAPLAAAREARRRGVPWIYNAQDLYPDILTETRWGRTPIVWPAWSVARRLEGSAAAIVPLTEAMAATLAARGVPRSKLHVIPNAVDLDRIRPIPMAANRWLAERGADEGVLRFLYAGNMGFAQDLETVLRAAVLVRERLQRPHVWWFVGEGSARERLERRAGELGLSNVHFLPFAPASRVAEVLGSGDLLLAPLRPGIDRYLVPNKLFAYMAAARPILAAVSPEGEVARLLRVSGAGLLVPSGDAEAFAAAVAELAEQGALRARLGEAGRRFVAQTRAPEVVASRYAELCERVLHQVGGRRP